MVSNPIKYLKDAFLNMPVKYSPDFMERFLPWMRLNFIQLLFLLVYVDFQKHYHLYYFRLACL